jgi:methylthioribose-1-phosphate isomerase
MASAAGSSNGLPRPLQYERGVLILLDQRALPGERRQLRCTDAAEVAQAIRDMAVRGAPAIGVAAAYGVAMSARGATGGGIDTVRRVAEEACARLEATRPTAVNLGAAVHRMRRVVMGSAELIDDEELVARLEAAAAALERFEVAASRAMGRHAAELLPDGARVYVHCNTGALATVGKGTALAGVYEAHARGRLAMVFVGETRPRLQGSRLTAFELAEAHIPHVVVVDSLAATLMLQRAIDAVLVGADRIAANGDVANKVGTYTLAVACAHHRVPLYVVAPTSSIDLGCETGADIPIEERDPAEVVVTGGERVAPRGTRALNPAFDITPASMLAALVTERGVMAPVSAAAIEAMLRSEG